MLFIAKLLLFLQPMQFHNPNILFALFAIIIPIIIHLFNFKRFKKLYFSNLAFLKEINIKTKKKRKLRDILILISRILLIASLVIAFAQPYIPSANADGEEEKTNLVLIYLDNSYSMEAVNENGLLLEQAKDKAKAIVQAWQSSDVFYLLTNDFAQQSSRSKTKEEILADIEELKLSPYFRNTTELSQRIAQYIEDNNAKNIHFYLVSDFQKTAFDFDKLGVTEQISTFLIPLKANETANLYIDTAWLANPVSRVGETQEVFFVIANSGEEDLEKQAVTLLIDSVQRGMTVVDVPAGEKIKSSLRFQLMQQGVFPLTIAIEDYPISFDDKLYLSLKVKAAFSIISLYQDKKSSYLEKIYAQDSVFQLQQIPIQNFDYAGLADCDLLILHEVAQLPSGTQSLIRDYVAKGGNLCIIPGKKMDFDDYRQFLTSMQANYYTSYDTSSMPVSSIEMQNAFFADIFESKVEEIDLPKAKANYAISRLRNSHSISLMEFSNKSSFLETSTYKDGRIYLLAVSLQLHDSNFPRHALFLPVFYKMLFYAVNREGTYKILGIDKTTHLSLEKQAEYEQFKLQQAETEKTFFPQIIRHDLGIDILLDNYFNDAGIYYLLTEKDTQDIIAINYSRKESLLEAYSIEEMDSIVAEDDRNISILSDKHKALDQIIREKNEAKALWKIFIILALIFAGIEVILLRFWKIQ